jgi:hypothetical protein
VTASNNPASPNGSPAESRITSALAKLAPSRVAGSISGLERWMECVEVGIWLFGIPLTLGVVKEIWSDAKIWAVLVSIGVAGETVLAALHSSLSAQHRILTHRKDREQEADIAAARERAEAAERRAQEAHWLSLPPNRFPERRKRLAAALEPFDGQRVVLHMTADWVTTKALVDVHGLLHGASWSVELESSESPFNPRGFKVENATRWVIESGPIGAIDRRVQEAANALCDGLIAYGYDADTVFVPEPSDVSTERKAQIEFFRDTIWVTAFIPFSPET